MCGEGLRLLFLPPEALFDIPEGTVTVAADTLDLQATLMSTDSGGEVKPGAEVLRFWWFVLMARKQAAGFNAKMTESLRPLPPHSSRPSTAPGDIYRTK